MAIERQAQLQAAGKRGEKLGVDWLRDTGSLAAQLVEAFRPFDSNGTARKEGDIDECMKWSRLLIDAANSLAQYESLKLSSVSLPPPQRDEYVRYTIGIFDDEGRQVKKVVDGEDVPLSRGPGHAVGGLPQMKPTTTNKWRLKPPPHHRAGVRAASCDSCASAA
jgi:hypothetical protein